MFWWWIGRSQTLNEIVLRARPHEAQTVIHKCPARFRVVSAGRRFGKTRLAIYEALDVAARGGKVWWVAPTFSLGEVGWLPLQSIVGKIPGGVVSKSKQRVVLPGGGSITIKSADNPRQLVGAGLDAVIVDEAALMEQSAWYQSLRPTLSDRRGRALFISTPRGYNWFYSIWSHGDDPNYPDWASFIFPTGANPHIPAEEIESARKDLPELIYEQEYMAQFIDLSGAVFRRVREAAINVPIDKPVKTHQYVMGIDTAVSVDYTVISVIDVKKNAQVYMDRFTRVDYPTLVNRIVATWKRFNADGVIIEANAAGQPVIEMCYERNVPVIPFTTTQASKDIIIRELQSAFENSQLTILDDQVLVNELLSFESTKTKTGLISYSAPPGMHDDCVMSLALAWRAAKNTSVVVFEA